MSPLRIAFYGHFGAGNLGNECTLQAVAAYARQRWPDAQLQCFCTEPEDVLRRHDMPGMRAMAVGEEWSWRGQKTTGGAPASDAELAARKAQSQPPRKRRNIVHRLARGLLLRAPRELAHWCALTRALSRCDLLIIAGTGILTDDCGPLLWPYDIFRLSALAAVLRVKLVFLSMGAGPIRSPLSRWFFKKALTLADYRSYRDEDSKQCIAGIGVNTQSDPVYPDLAFGLPSAHLAAQAAARAPSAGTVVSPVVGPVVGLGLKDYSSDAAGTNSYSDYLDAMARFVVWLRGQGCTVRLLIGDAQYDSQVRLDLMERLPRFATPGVAAGAEVRVDPVPTVAELLRQLAECDVVISPRFHNLVLGLTLYKRVIALSDLRKVEVLLSDLGLPQYCLPMSHLDCEALVACFMQLQGDAERLQLHIKERVDSYRAAVSTQYASLFASAALPAPAAVSESG